MLGLRERDGADEALVTAPREAYPSSDISANAVKYAAVK
jgi:hypothetical protein